MSVSLMRRFDAVTGLRGRLTAAFMGTVLVMGLPGAVGVYLVMRAGEQVSHLTEAVTPLRTESAALIGNLHALRGALRRGMSHPRSANHGADLEAAHGEMENIAREWRAGIARLRGLALKAGVHLPVERAERAYEEAMRLADVLLDLDDTRDVALARRDAQMASFRAARQRMESVLRDVAALADSQMAISEELAKTTDQAGSATEVSLAALLADVLNDIYPRLTGADRLLHTMVQLEKLASTYVLWDSSAPLESVDNDVASLLRTAAVYLRRVGGHLDSVGQAASLAGANEALDGIRLALTGREGAFASHRAMLAAVQAVEEGRAALGAVESDLDKLVTEVEREAQALGEQVTETIHRWSRNAFVGLLATALAGSVLALSLGFASARRLTAPLARLSEAVSSLAAGRAVPDLGNLLDNGDIGAAAASVLERTAHLATHDGLTGLPNRALFRDRLTRALAEAHREGDSVAVLYLDLDRFKEVNDSLGHAAGDSLLVQVAARLKGSLRESDTLARLGGDEFAVVQRSDSQPGDAEALSLRIIEALRVPFDLNGHQASIGVSVGVAARSGEGAAIDPGVLLQEADAALYRSKEEGRGTFRFFQEEMNRRLQQRKALAADLRRAFTEGQFRLHFQPQVAMGGRELVGAEALLRWHHPERGDVRPDEFIPFAEETGLIIPIGEWVLRAACSQAVAWPELKRIAVNVSPAQFRQAGFVEKVRAALHDSGLVPSRLELEITESILLSDTEEMLLILADLRALGVSIAMDDFGTGYSSLGYLRKFRFDKIKIDRSFVRGLAAGSDSEAIIRAVLGMSQALGIRSNAEGVEEEVQVDMLRRAGCDEAQGFLFGRPMSAEDFTALLAAEPGAAAATAA